jgi:broad specificity phosphatase PhoE
MTDKSTTIYLVRHGESESNRDGIISGHDNPPLTNMGRKQVKDAKKALQSVKFDVVYSSDLQRARETVEIIAETPIPPHRQLKNLRERNFGSIDGKPDKYLEGYVEARKRMSEDDNWQYKHVASMESDQEILYRFSNELEKIARSHPGKTILIGSHGSLIRSLLRRHQNILYNEAHSVPFKNAGYVKLIYDGKRFKVLEVYAD